MSFAKTLREARAYSLEACPIRPVDGNAVLWGLGMVVVCFGGAALLAWIA